MQIWKTGRGVAGNGVASRSRHQSAELERKAMGPVFSDVTGVVLAGGKSSRFGSNKAFARLGEATFLERIMSRLSKLFGELVLVTNTPESYTGLPIKVLVDLSPYQGPMGGIVTALDFAKPRDIFVIACDMPLLDIPTILEIMEHRRHASAVIPWHDSQPEYLMAFYSQATRPAFRASLDQGVRSLKQFCKTLKNIAWVPISPRAATNINTPNDLRAAEEYDAY